MKRMNLFRLFFAGAGALALVACRSDGKEEIPAEKRYELISIGWTLEEGDGQETVERPMPETIYQNGGRAAMPLSIDPMNGVRETSNFLYNPEADALIGALEEETIVFVPSWVEGLSSAEYRYMASGVEAPFRLQTAYVAPTREARRNIDLEPGLELRYNVTVRMKRIKATYCARFREKTGSGEIREVKGKWEGELYSDVSDRIDILELE